ncbi:magnesium transporter [soil metagenome]
MPGPDENGQGTSEPIPTLIPDHPSLETGEVTTALAPEVAQQITADIRAIAEDRGETSDVVDISELTGPSRSRRLTQPLPPSFSQSGSFSPSTTTLQLSPEVENELSTDELRDAWPLLDLEERRDGLRVLPREDAEEFFIALSAQDQASLLMSFRSGQRRQWMRMLEPDDAADLIQEAPDENRGTLLALLDAPTKIEVTALLAYKEDEAGGLMSTRYARLRPNMRAGEAIAYLQRQARDKVETIYVTYVLDGEKLVGVASFRELFAADASKFVSEIMETDVTLVTDEMDQETVARVFSQSGLNVIPVVDKNFKMKGIVTIDDIVDVVREEATEDAQKFGGVEALELPYLESTRRDMIKKRGRWLAILMVGEMLTATAMGFFEHALIPLLTIFLPLIISSGGNSGSQASTLVIRAMALGEVRPNDWWRVLRREILIGAALGIGLGILAIIRISIWGMAGKYGDHYFIVGIAVALAVVGCVVWGTLAGSMLPFVLRKVGADPANASAPLVATLVDVSGIVIYFTVANLILRGILL